MGLGNNIIGAHIRAIVIIVSDVYYSLHPSPHNGGITCEVGARAMSIIKVIILGAVEGLYS